MIAREKPEDEALPTSTRPQVLGDVHLVLTVGKPKMLQKCLFCFQIPRSHMFYLSFMLIWRLLKAGHGLASSSLRVSRHVKVPWESAATMLWEEVHLLKRKEFPGTVAPTDLLMSQKSPRDPWLFKSQERLRTGTIPSSRLQWLKSVQQWSSTLPLPDSAIRKRNRSPIPNLTQGY